jgi:glycosyltransferase involved in cell wall biosynthesis
MTVTQDEKTETQVRPLEFLDGNRVFDRFPLASPVSPGIDGPEDGCQRGALHGLTPTTRHLKVLHVITGLTVGGAERSLSLILEGTQAQLQEVLVVSLTASGHFHDVIRRMGINVVTLDMMRGRPSPWGLLRLIRIIRRFRPDILQSWMYHADLLSLFALWLSGRRRSTKLFWGVRCTNITRFERRLLLSLTVRLCALFSWAPDRIIVNSRAGAADHRKIGYAGERMTVIHNGIQPERFYPDPALRARGRRQLDLPDSVVMVVMAARRHQMKDYPTFQQALALLPDTIGVAIGMGTQFLQVPANLIGLGIRHDIETVFNAADIYVSSAAYGEGTSNAILEAMACGLPVVATDVGDSAFIVGDGGLIVPPGDPEALADAIRRLGADAGLRQRMSQAAIERVAEHFSQAGCIGRFMALYASEGLPDEGVCPSMPNPISSTDSPLQALSADVSAG